MRRWRSGILSFVALFGAESRQPSAPSPERLSLQPFSRKKRKFQREASRRENAQQVKHKRKRLRDGEERCLWEHLSSGEGHVFTRYFGDSHDRLACRRVATMPTAYVGCTVL
ncbi:hypothetical protein B0J14DRAFT_274735 [Halenospora varia]|nr:hypothetical protein B0J14DRAFT_274735 [Halenospora varia]